MVTKYLPQPQVFWEDLNAYCFAISSIYEELKCTVGNPQAGRPNVFNFFFFFWCKNKSVSEDLVFAYLSQQKSGIQEAWVQRRKIFLLYDRSVKQASCHSLLLQYALVQHEQDNTGHPLKQINGQSCCLLTVTFILEKFPPVTKILKQEGAVLITEEYKANK